MFGWAPDHDRTVATVAERRELRNWRERE